MTAGAPAPVRRRPIVAVAAAGIALLVVVVGALILLRPSRPVATIGQPAPDIVGTGLDGAPVSLASLRGHPVVVNFWASWCIPCRNEFPLFEQRLAKLGSSDGLVLLGVLYKDDSTSAKRFADDFKATWQSVPDADGSLASAYRVVAPPQTYFIDRAGILRGMQIGEVLQSDWDTQYAKIAS